MSVNNSRKLENFKIVMVGGSSAGLPENPLSTVHGGTGNSVGYIQTGKRNGTTIGTRATIEGSNNTGSGTDSHTEGSNNTASGAGAHAEGSGTKASGTGSHAGGLGTVAGHAYQTAVGKYNNNKSGNLFEVGNGSSSSSKSNAFEVASNGNAVIGGNITAGGTISDANGVLNAVTANPSGSATSTLAKLGIGDTVYDIPSYQNQNVRSAHILSVSENVLSTDIVDTIATGDTLKKKDIVLLKSDRLYTLGSYTYWIVRLYTASSTYIDVVLRDLDTSEWAKSIPAESTLILVLSGTVASETPSIAHVVGCITDDGYVRSGQKSGTTIGSNATAEGTDTTASGSNAHAEGEKTIASAQGAHAEGGYYTSSNTDYPATASGKYAHAEGEGSVASGEASHAEGTSIASGAFAHAEGANTSAIGNFSHSEGHAIAARGEASHVEGYDTNVAVGATAGHAEGYQSAVTEDYAHAEGYASEASGTAAHSEGTSTIASGDSAHAEGGMVIIDDTRHYTTASGDYSHAEGLGSVASGAQSHAEGYLTSATTNNAHAEGGRTVANGSNSHTEGYNTQVESGAANAHAEGNTTSARNVSAHAEGTGSIASGESSHAEGDFSWAEGDYSHAEGGSLFISPERYRTTASGDFSHAEGSSTIASGEGAHAEGGYSVVADTHVHATTASGKYSHAEGKSTIASGEGAHAEGGCSIAGGYIYKTTASGNYSHAEGIYAQAEGNGSHAEGENTDAQGVGSHAEGYDTVAAGNYSHAEGKQTIAEGDYSHAEGGSIIGSQNSYYNTASGDYSHVEGLANTASGEASHAEGRKNTASGNNSHAEGSETTASGNYSHTEGFNTSATNSYAHAEGCATTASGYYSHAAGIGTVAGYSGQTVVGKFNDNKSDTLFEVGNGMRSDEGRNAFEVKSNGDIFDGHGNSLTAVSDALFSDDTTTVDYTNVITIPNAPDVHAQSLKVKFAPVQDLHGQANPYPAGGGKNKIPMTVDGIKAANTTGTWNGNVYTINGGTITILTDNDGNITGFKANGTFSADTQFYVSNNKISLDTSKSWILNGCPSGGGSSTYRLSGGMYNGTSWVRNSTDTGSGVTLDFTGADSVRTSIVVSTGSVSNKIFYPMIRVSTVSDATFAPYSNECPISGHTGASATIVDGNLFSRDNVLSAYIYNDSTGTITASQTGSKTVFAFLPAGTYTFAKKVSSVFRSARYASRPTIGSQCISGSMANYDTSATSHTYTVESDCWLAVMPINSSSASDLADAQAILDSIQIQAGASITINKPQGYNATTPFGDTYYSGYVDVVTGELVVDRYGESLPVLNVYQRTGNANCDFATFQLTNSCTLTDSTSVRSKWLIDKARLWASGETFDTVSTTGVLLLLSSAAKQVAISMPKGTSLADAQALFGNVQIIYLLANPIRIPLTPQLVKLFKGYNTIYSSDGQVRLEYTANLITCLNEDIAKKADNASLGYVENGNTASRAYSANDIIVWQGQLVKATTSIASGAAFTLGTNVVSTSLGELITAILNA